MAILLHPTRATHDLPYIGVRKGERMYHVVSDLVGRAGSDELRTFVRGCGMRADWVQYRGSYREHFDAHGHLVECLRLRGARLVGNHELGRLLRTKREAQQAATAPQEPSPSHSTAQVELDPTSQDLGDDFQWGPIPGVPSESELRALGEMSIHDVLEIGCGDGARAQAVLRWGGHYTGLDDDPRRVAAARIHLEDLAAPRRILLGSLQDLSPLPDAAFDLVFDARGALDYVPHLPQALAAIARVLRPGGRCALMTVSPFFDGFPLDAPAERSLYPIRGYFDRSPRHSASNAAPRFHRTVGDWIAAFGAADLRVTDALELEPHPRDWRPIASQGQPRWEQVAMLPYTLIWRASKSA